ncbi:MAG: hypothetical protein PHS49_06595 [Candidatus Gracilibacteria bacterium]|nr:hypothetical protein [Candidatus Gracilibacteria bacterium]
MNNFIDKFDSFTHKDISLDLFESKFPILFSIINDKGYLIIMIDGKKYFVGVVDNGIFKSRPFFNFNHLEIIEKAYKMSDIVLLKEEIKDEIISLIDNIYLNINIGDSKKD